VKNLRFAKKFKNYFCSTECDVMSFVVTCYPVVAPRIFKRNYQIDS
jgi:hypothetical protein